MAKWLESQRKSQDPWHLSSLESKHLVHAFKTLCSFGLAISKANMNKAHKGKHQSHVLTKS